MFERPQRAFAEFESRRRARVQLVAKAARRTSSSKAAGTIVATIRDRMMPTIVRMGAKQTAKFVDWTPPEIGVPRRGELPTP
jgi:FAD-dependent urate hydroxylase